MLDNKDLSFLLETAVVAARLAGQRAMEEINYVKAVQKGPSDLVTETDVRCQQIIIDTIKQNYSDHGFLAEEGKNNNLFKQPPRADSNIWWIIDPIDGTNNFAHKILSFAVSIGVISDGRPVLGVIYDPSTDSMFTAAGDSPPQYNTRRIEASMGDLNIFETVGVESLYSDGVPNWLTFLLKTLRCRSLGTTALHLAYVAKGSFIAAIMDKPRLWDITAGAFLAQSAGAIVTDWEGKPLWPVDMQNYTGRPIATLAANKKVHKKLVDLIAEK
ncbi:MAG: inositol monophosphatase [Sedimentisphaerales bacterium]